MHPVLNSNARVLISCSSIAVPHCLAGPSETATQAVPNNCILFTNFYSDCLGSGMTTMDASQTKHYRTFPLPLTNKQIKQITWPCSPLFCHVTSLSQTLRNNGTSSLMYRSTWPKYEGLGAPRGSISGLFTTRKSPPGVVWFRGGEKGR